VSERIEPEDVGGLEGLPPSDPRVRALEEQPRARALQKAYREFASPEVGIDSAEMMEAEDRLQVALEREIGVPLGEPTEAGSSARAVRPRRRPGFLGALLDSQWRPAFAVAALVVVAGGAWLLTATRREGAPVMRGPESGAVGDAAAPRAVPLPDGSWRLTWPGSADAESYEVVFLSAELTEIARVTGLRETHLDLRPDALPSGLVLGSHVLWRAHAMRGTDEVSRTAVVPLALEAGR
jgi:hypothetical protein